MKKKSGIVYVMGNPAIPDIVKIGKTKNLTDRMRSLYTTGVPLPFRCVYAKQVEDMDYVDFGIKSSVVRSVLDSNSVDIPSANKRSISKSQLGEMISSGTYYISCWMTMAQIEKMKTKKVFFSNLD